jgi:hypothetical protein
VDPLQAFVKFNIEVEEEEEEEEEEERGRRAFIRLVTCSGEQIVLSLRIHVESPLFRPHN